MMRRKTPLQKKTLAYKRDFVLSVEHPKAFRRYWQRRKAASVCKERRQAHQKLFEITPLHAIDKRPDFPLKPVRRERVRKWRFSAVPLGVRVIQRKNRRTERIAWNFFKHSYRRTMHRERFSAFLTDLVQNKIVSAHPMVLLFEELLDPPATHGQAECVTAGDQRIVWLRAFLVDEPTWEQRLRNWMHMNDR